MGYWGEWSCEREKDLMMRWAGERNSEVVEKYLGLKKNNIAKKYIDYRTFYICPSLAKALENI